MLAAVSAVVLIANTGSIAFADRPRALNARVVMVGENRYQFEVNIVHEDDSWTHYVDRWEVVGKGGKVLATEKYYYPRIDEDIIWRFLKGIKVDPGTEWVVYRLHDLKDGYGREKLVRMPTKDKPDTGWQ